METNIKAIVFDYGEVIEFFSGINPFVLTAEETGISLDKIRDVYYRYNHLANAENMPWNEMYEKVLSEFDISGELRCKIQKMIANNWKKSVLNTELISGLSGLKEQGFKVAIFSNYSSELRKRLVDKKINDLFDEIVVSGEIGFQKPDKRAFEVLFSKLKVKPKEVIFIDDTNKSLEGSDSIGYVPILFTDNKQLKTDLNKFGVNINYYS